MINAMGDLNNLNYVPSSSTTMLATLVFSIAPHNLNYYILGVALWLYNLWTFSTSLICLTLHGGGGEYIYFPCNLMAHAENA